MRQKCKRARVKFCELANQSLLFSNETETSFDVISDKIARWRGKTDSGIHLTTELGQSI